MPKFADKLNVVIPEDDRRLGISRIIHGKHNFIFNEKLKHPKPYENRRQDTLYFILVSCLNR